MTQWVEAWEQTRKSKYEFTSEDEELAQQGYSDWKGDPDIFGTELQKTLLIYGSGKPDEGLKVKSLASAVNQILVLQNWEREWFPSEEEKAEHDDPLGDDEEIRAARRLWGRRVYEKIWDRGFPLSIVEFIRRVAGISEVE
jgi:hypothetical protein